jgi:ELMO/CED-12 family
MGNIACSRQLPPSTSTIEAIESLRSKINTPFADDKHEPLLRQVHDLAFSSPDSSLPQLLLQTTVDTTATTGNSDITSYARTGLCWKYLGFQQEDPASDFRGGGELALENMLYFLSSHTAVATEMIGRRKNRELGKNYPWAAVSINVTRMVAVVFEIITANGLSKGIQHTNQSYWLLLDPERSDDPQVFDKLYVAAFVLLDRLYDEMDGSYMEFPRIIKEAQIQFTERLQQVTSLNELLGGILSKDA